MLKRLSLFLIVITIISCSDNRQRRKEAVADIIVKLSEQRADWESLTRDILNDSYSNQHLDKFIDLEQLNDDLKNRLKTKGIIRLSVHKLNDCKTVEYSTNWIEYPIGSLFLTWSTCDSVQTQEGYYLDNFNSNFTEVWGIGNNWKIIIDSDFI